MSAPVEIVPVQTKSQWRDFHHLPFAIYRDDPNWVAPLLLERNFHFQAAHNPYFKHAQRRLLPGLSRTASPWAASPPRSINWCRSAIRTAPAISASSRRIDDAEVFAALLKAAEDWLRGEGMKRAVGPVSFSLWDQPGLLVKGFDTPPSVMMNHHRPYYEGRIAAHGYQKAEDLIAYRYGPDAPTEMLKGWWHARCAAATSPCATSAWTRSISSPKSRMLLDIINDAWSDNWGFVPMTKAEIDDLAGILKVLLRPGDVAIAEYQGKRAAFAAIFPNLNEAIRDMNGRLFPFNWIKLLWRHEGRAHQDGAHADDGCAQVAAEFLPRRGAGAGGDPLGARISISRAAWYDSELSWILERNTRVRHVIEMVGGVPYKTYRLYEKPL